MNDGRACKSLLLALLDGVEFANATRGSGKPARIRWPDDVDARNALVDAHLNGASGTLTFHAVGREPWQERVDAVVLAGFCPGADGQSRWMGIDLDAAGPHGAGGLVDPQHAARCIAERAANSGLLDGLVVARSRSGGGRHIWLVPPGPCPVGDAAVAVAQLAAWGFQVAERDANDNGVEHAFRCGDGSVVRPGKSVAFELIPRGTSRPPMGWALALPCAGALAGQGGGIIVDPFEDRPVVCPEAACCDQVAWTFFAAEARATLAKRRTSGIRKLPKRRCSLGRTTSHATDRIDPRTQAFLDGRATEGTRNVSAFAASANLLGCGVEESEAELLILAGTARCGLPEREARAAFASAVGTLGRRERHR